MMRFLATALAGFVLLIGGVLPARAAGPEALPKAGYLSLEELRRHFSREGDRYADIGGVNLRYRDEGQGRVVVLLHGSYGSLDSWDGVAASLKSRYRVIRFDMPGMGLSSTIPASQPTNTPFADDLLKTLLDRLGVKQAVFVGVSSGGSLAYYFTSLHPQMVEALVLSNAPADPVIGSEIKRSPELYAEFAEAERTGFKRYSYWKTYLEWLAGRTERMTPEIVQHYYDLNRREPFKDAHYYWRSTNDVPKTRAALDAVKAPTLLVWGAKDLVLPLDKAKALESYLPNATVSTLVMADVGHYPPLETPARFADIVDSYIASVLPSP